MSRRVEGAVRPGPPRSGRFRWRWPLLLATILSVLWFAFAWVGMGKRLDEECRWGLAPPGFELTDWSQQYIELWPPTLRCRYMNVRNDTSTTVIRAYPVYSLLITGGMAVIFAVILGANALLGSRRRGELQAARRGPPSRSRR